MRIKKATSLISELRVHPEVEARLAYYVYAYVDPRNSQIFYVGKGCRSRALDHLDEIGESAKLRRIAEIHAAGLKPRIDILAHGIADEQTALLIETAVIDVLWPDKTLTNRVRGFQSLEIGRVPLTELVFQYAAEPVTITDPCMLIRINRLYRPGMIDEALYEVTRGVWKCGPRREKARFALAVFQGVVREVYQIESWHPAGTLTYRTRAREQVTTPNRWEFSGKVAEKVAAKYKGGSVESYLPRGSRFPFAYVGCGDDSS